MEVIEKEIDLGDKDLNSIKAEINPFDGILEHVTKSLAEAQMNWIKVARENDSTQKRPIFTDWCYSLVGLIS